MKKIAAICLLSLASLQARADLTIIEHLSSGGNSQDLTMKIKGEKARVDVGNAQISTIIDATSGDMLMLIHAQKMFMKMSGEKAKAMLAQIKKSHGGDDADTATPKITDTGKSEKVGDYKAEIYTADTADTKCTFWVTKDIPDYATIQVELKKMQTLQEKLGQGKGPDISKIDGIPVKSEIVKGGVTTTISLVSVKEEPVDNSELVPPTDYTEMQMPAMPAGPAGGGEAPPAAPSAPAPQQ